MPGRDPANGFLSLATRLLDRQVRVAANPEPNRLTAYLAANVECLRSLVSYDYLQSRDLRITEDLAAPSLGAGESFQCSLCEIELVGFHRRCLFRCPRRAPFKVKLSQHVGSLVNDAFRGRLMQVKPDS